MCNYPSNTEIKQSNKTKRQTNSSGPLMQTKHKQCLISCSDSHRSHYSTGKKTKYNEAKYKFEDVNQLTSAPTNIHSLKSVFT